MVSHYLTRIKTIKLFIKIKFEAFFLPEQNNPTRTFLPVFSTTINFPSLDDSAIPQGPLELLWYENLGTSPGFAEI